MSSEPLSSDGIPVWMQRTNILFGEEKINKLRSAHVLVVGLGGVGGLAAEMIARAGVGKMTIVDHDTVDTTNRNRQVPALSSTVGKYKAEVLAERLKDINPDLDLVVKREFLGEGNTYSLIQEGKFTYVLDCIDSLTSKCWLIRACVENNTPIASSMGAGAKSNPSCVHITDISESKYDGFAAAVRRRLSKWGIKHGIPVVYSTEEIDKSRLIHTPNAVKKTIVGTVSYMPTTFGALLSSIVIRDLINGPGTTVKFHPEKKKVHVVKKKKNVKTPKDD